MVEGEHSGNSDSEQEFCVRGLGLNITMSRSVKVNSNACNSTEGIDPETEQEGGHYAMPDPGTEAVLDSNPCA